MALENIQQVRNDVRSLKAEIEEFLNADDEQLLIDSIEGETDAMEVISALLIERMEAQAAVAGLRAQLDTITETLRQRISAMDSRAAQALRGAGLIADEIGVDRLRRPEGTLHRRKTPPRVEIIDEGAIPADFVEFKPILLKSEIAKALKQGQSIAGAALIEQPDGWAVRTAKGGA